MVACRGGVTGEAEGRERRVRMMKGNKRESAEERGEGRGAGAGGAE